MQDSSDSRRRLLSLNSYHYRRGGSDAIYQDHQALFRAHGWQTTAFSMQHPDNETSEWENYFVEELEFGRPYGWRQKLSMAGKVIYSLEARRKLAAMLEVARPNIAHAHCIYHHLSPSVLGLLRERGIPTVMTAHDLKLACPAYKMMNRGGICEKCRGNNLSHLVINRCIHGSLAASSLVAVESAIHKSLGLYKRNLSRVIAPSKFYLEKLVEWGWNREQLVHIPNFLPVENYQPHYTPGDYFLYFGRLAPEKGISTLVAAAQLAGVNLRIVGSGPEECKIAASIRGSESSISMLGYLSGQSLRDQVHNCRAVVLPSEWYENAPVSVMEAFAMGKPVIGADIGGITEMVIDEQSGHLFESGSIEQLANLLDRFTVMAPAKLEEMGRRGRGTVLAQYTPERYYERMCRLYASLGVA